MFAVIAEVEGYVEAVFPTVDRTEAHRIFAAATEQESKVSDADPARITLIDCLPTGEAFLARLAESAAT